MTEQETKAPKERSRETRGPGYPSFGVGEAIGLVRKLWERERRTAVPGEVAVKAWGYSSLSGMARTKLATLKKYDLLDEDRSGVKVSDLAIEILQHPENTEPYREAVRRAALAPDLFKHLRGSFPEASNDALKRELVFKRGFKDGAADQVIRAFRDTMALAKMEESAHTAKVEGDEAGGEEMVDDQVRPAATATHKPANLHGTGFGMYDPAVRAYCWPLPGGVTAEVRFTGTAGPAHFEFLQKYLELAKEAVKAETPGNED